jgi:excisionase family DNA binding protein
MPMKLITLSDVAGAMKVSESTVKRWVRGGLLRAYKVGKRGQLRVREEDLEEFLEKQRLPNSDLIEASAKEGQLDD